MVTSSWNVPPFYSRDEGASGLPATVLAEDGLELFDRQRPDRAAVRRHVRGAEQGVVDGLFGRVEDRLEQARDRIGRQHHPLLRTRRTGHALRWMCRECDGEVAGAG